MSSYAAPRPIARPLLPVLVLLLLFATLLAAPPARAAEALEAEPNGSTATAQPLALGTGVAAVFGPSGDCDNNFYDCDVYRIAAPSAGRLILDLRFSDSLGTASSFELAVQDARGDYIYTETISSADYDGSRLRGLGMYVDSGTSYVQLKTRVSGFSSGYIWSGQAYSLNASLTPGVVETEKNGTTATADIITLGQTIEGSIFDGDCNSSDCDYFRLQLPSPARLSIDFRFACDLGTGKVYSVSSYDNAGNRLTTADLQGSDCEGEMLRATTVAAPAGNVYFLVSARTGGVTAGLPYRLTVTRTDTPAPDVDVTRLAGSDRQGTAVEISKVTFAPGVPVTYVATGGKFPDALAAAPAAATQGGPLLLVDRDTMSQSVRDELSRLRPVKIVVVGSALSVGDGLLNELRGYAGSGGIQRIGGVDRYDTADRIVRYAFPSGASRAWIATGEKFPDALGASAAAGSVDAPVLLVNGGQASAAPATRQLLTDLGTSSLTIAGSSLSVSEGIRSSLGVPSTRIGGTDRYDTSEQLNRAAFTAAETVYFATGENFPDALAGATAAGYTSSPLFAVRPDCVPRKVLDDITALGADRVILLGGPGTLSDDVARLKAC